MTFGVYTDPTKNASILAKEPARYNTADLKHKFVSIFAPHMKFLKAFAKIPSL